MTEAIGSNSIRRSGVFRKYVGYFIGLVVFVLAINGGLEIWFVYRDTIRASVQSQSEKADAAARRITESIQDMMRQISWATRASASTVEQHRADYLLLLEQVPAIEELFKLDGNGREQIRVSRAGVSTGRNADFSREPAFTEATRRQVWFGPVEFFSNNPYMTIAVAHSGRNAGVTVAEINLKSLSDILRSVQDARGSFGYVVGADGRLILTSPNLHWPLGSDLSNLAQVAAARNASAAAVTTGKDFDGRAVVTAHAKGPRMDWYVFVEQPMSQALEPVYALLARIASLLGLGLLIAVLTGMLLARQMVVPIRALQAGARRLGQGDFDQRIEVKTGDEIEDLAEQFNRMAVELQQSYSGLEQKVEERTRELAIASAHKDQFFANMSHELRTPLNAVLGYAELLVDGIYGTMPDKALDVLQRIQSNGKHLLGLINDVLDISKIEAGQLNLALDDYSMKTLVQSVIAATESLAQNKGLALRSEVSDALPAARGDERRLTQVLLNIVGNAIKFTDKGSVTIRAAEKDGMFDLSVTDTGPGIAPQDRDRIFEEFQQVDNSSTRQKGGTGLGLAIARRLVRMHGGDIALESAPGKGSTFHVAIPVRVEQPALQPELQPEPQA
ncbi:MAG: sensor histidine kinase [Pseudorhodoplanes sp.]